MMSSHSTMLQIICFYGLIPENKYQRLIDSQKIRFFTFNLREQVLYLFFIYMVTNNLMFKLNIINILLVVIYLLIIPTKIKIWKNTSKDFHTLILYGFNHILYMLPLPHLLTEQPKLQKQPQCTIHQLKVYSLKVFIF